MARFRTGHRRELDKMPIACPTHNVLEVNHLSVSFGGTHVLTDLSFQLAKGSSLAVIGRNGAEKTVLFRALIVALPFSGTVQWASGVRIGYVPQERD